MTCVAVDLPHRYIYHALRNALAVEVSRFFVQEVVLQQQRPARRPIASYAYQKQGVRGTVVSFFGWVNSSMVERRIWRRYEADSGVRVQDNRHQYSTIIKVDSNNYFITQGYIW